MTLPSRHWVDLPWTAFAGLPPNTVAVLPIAATEQHGPHLPVSVDATINQGVLARALEKLPAETPVLVLPTQAIGCSVEHVRFPGTLTSTPETLIALWTEIGESVARAGVRRLLLLNSHGGQPQIAQIVCRRLRAKARMFAATCLWSRLGRPPGVELSPEEARHGIHAGLVETSVMRKLRPDLVRMEHAQHFRSRWLDHEGACAVLTSEGAAAFGWEVQDLHPDGALGDASAATVELGERFVDTAGDLIAKLILEIGQIDLDAWFA